MGWQLPAMRCTTLGTADVPTVSSSGRGDQLHQVAQSAELPVARAGRPSRAAAERRGCGIPRRGQRVNGLCGLLIIRDQALQETISLKSLTKMSVRTQERKGLKPAPCG